MDREGGNKKNMETERVNLSQFPHSLSIPSSFSLSLSIFSQPGCQAAKTCATLTSYRYDSKGKQIKMHAGHRHKTEEKQRTIATTQKHTETEQTDTYNVRF